MTGFGAAARDGVRVEARAVNGRFLELKVRQPFGPEVESRIKKRVKQRLGRGRVDLAIGLDPSSSAEASEGFDEAARAALLDEAAPLVDALLALRELANAKGLPSQPLNLLALHDRVVRKEGSARPEAPASLDAAVDAAVDALLEMRRTEGEALQKVLADQLAQLRAQVGEARAAMQGEPARLMAARTEQLQALLAKVDAGDLDPAAVQREVALLVQRGDVTEELDRLDMHFEQFAAVLSAPAKVGQGKRLDFLTQELLREVTTMGSKVTAHAASAQLIDAKATIERMREQVQNVE